ncbi:MAG: STAS domain-containing protein [Pseudomonadota bacterium]
MIQSETIQAGIVRVTLQGPRLDAAVADTIKSELKGQIDAGARRLEVDFTNVQFMDSSGLGALVGALKLMGSGGQLEIVNPCSTVMKVLRLTRMNKVFIVREGPAA